MLADDYQLNEVEYYYDDVFYFICNDGFTYEDAVVVCRENAGTSFAFGNTTSLSALNSTNQIFNSTFQCVGHEDSLCDCPQTEAICSSDLVVQILCDPPGNTRVN